MASLTFTKVIRESHSLTHGEGSLSFGQLIDQQVLEAAERGEEVQTVALELTEADWSAYLAQLRGDKPQELDQDVWPGSSVRAVKSKKAY